MKRIVGIDIGNSTTEAALAEIHSNGEVKFLSSAIASTCLLYTSPSPRDCS